MERTLGLSYPTVRSRLEEAFDAAGLGRDRDAQATHSPTARLDTVQQLNQGEITAAEAISKLRELKERK